MDGGKIKAARRRKNLTQQNVADALYCDRSYISKIESNLVIPSPDFLQELCRHLGIQESDVPGTATELTWRYPELGKAHRLLRQGRIEEAQLLAETVWAHAIRSNHAEAAEALFLTWLETLAEHPQSEQLGAVFMTQMLMKAAHHDWTDLFDIGLTFQQTLVKIRQLSWAEWVSQTLLAVSPPPTVRFRLEVGLGTITLRLGRAEEALSHYHNGLALWNPELRQTNLGRCYHGVGASALYLGNLELAQHATQLACDVYQSVSPDLHHMALQNMGIIHASLGQWVDAERSLLEVLEFWSKHERHQQLLSVREAIAEHLPHLT